MRYGTMECAAGSLFRRELFCRDGGQFENTAVLDSLYDITSAQRQAYGIQLLGVLKGEVGRPRGFVLDEINRHLSRIAPYMN